MITDMLVNAAQNLLKDQNKHISGMQNTLLGEHYQFLPETTESVQVVHTGTATLGHALHNFAKNILI